MLLYWNCVAMVRAENREYAMKRLAFDPGGHIAPDAKSVIKIEILGDAAGHGAGHNNVGDAGGHGSGHILAT